MRRTGERLPCRVVSVGIRQDANGNTIVKTDSTGTTTYGWDYDDRLTTVTLPGSGGSVSYAYDPFGRRIRKISSSGTSIYAYDGARILETVNASGNSVARYTHGPNIDEPLATLQGTTVGYYEADGLGSITSLTDSTGALAQTYAYDSFGKTLASAGGLSSYFQYTGREFDSETGIYFYRARYYDQNAGRFLSEDPDDFSSGPNFYTYVSNHPTDFIDPSGRQKKPKPPRPTQPPDTAYYICCKGGQFGVCDGPLARPSSFNNPIYNNMLLKCQKEHEQKHMDDFNSGKFLSYIQPSSCVGQPNNTPIGTNPAFKPNIECPAYAKQLDCLKQMESLMTPEINHVKDMQKKYHCPDCGK